MYFQPLKLKRFFNPPNSPAKKKGGLKISSHRDLDFEAQQVDLWL